jgi:hypothetical protein
VEEDVQALIEESSCMINIFPNEDLARIEEVD